MNSNWQTVAAHIVAGHRVASGLNGNPHFPGGTLKMQAPFFRRLGLDLNAFHGGTMNVSISPYRYRVLKAPVTFRQVKWHPTEPAEDFSFFDVQLQRADGVAVAGKIYHPHPDTKPAHFQRPDVLELLFPFVEGLSYGDAIQLHIPGEQMLIEKPG